MAKLVMERADTIPALGEVFRRYGFEGASIARFSENTHLGKDSLYHFFPGGKEEMAKAVLSDIEDWFEQNIFLPLQDSADHDGHAIDLMFTAVDDYFKSGQRICLVGVFALTETRDRFSTEVNQYFKKWIDSLATALIRANVSPAEAKQTATTVVAGIQGALVIAQALDDQNSFSNMLKQLRQLTQPIK